MRENRYNKYSKTLTFRPATKFAEKVTVKTGDLTRVHDNNRPFSRRPTACLLSGLERGGGVNRETDTTENITFPQTTYAGGKLQEISEIGRNFEMTCQEGGRKIKVFFC